MSGKLYIVGTPIGNLGDISERALKTLAFCDFIAAEDTRVTSKLLNHFGIKKPMVSYFEHNRRERGEDILSRLINGESCALVTDAGMPSISDPGEDLARLCLENGIEVTVVPGPSALTAALALSAMPSGRFCFEGFLSMAKNSRKKHLEELRHEKRTMVFYEAPHKLAATLRDLYTCLGDREIAIVREITKIYEEVIKSSLKKAAEGGIRDLKGEIVLIVEGAAEQEEAEKISPEQAAKMAAELAEKEGISANDASKIISRETGVKKGEIYRLLF